MFVAIVIVVDVIVLSHPRAAAAAIALSIGLVVAAIEGLTLVAKRVTSFVCWDINLGQGREQSGVGCFVLCYLWLRVFV
ncbi:hypothetical protein V6N13_019796 [Hibiscus sabdariffa]